MSKYTTQVRYILETAAGLDESAGLSQVDSIIEQTWRTVFPGPSDPNDNTYTGPLIGSALFHITICQMILKHYYMREIGAETVGLWKMWMRSRLAEIADYYTNLYQTTNALDVEKALLDIDLTRTRDAEYARETADSGSDALTHNTTIARTGTVTDSGSAASTDKYSDTPQGGLSGLQSDTYLTEARMINETNGNTRTDALQDHTTGTDSRATSNSGTEEGSDSYTERTYGKNGGASYSKLLAEYRSLLINLDDMIIAEFADCFMNVY